MGSASTPIINPAITGRSDAAREFRLRRLGLQDGGGFGRRRQADGDKPRHFRIHGHADTMMLAGLEQLLHGREHRLRGVTAKACFRQLHGAVFGQAPALGFFHYIYVAGGLRAFLVTDETHILRRGLEGAAKAGDGRAVLADDALAVGARFGRVARYQIGHGFNPLPHHIDFVSLRHA